MQKGFVSSCAVMTTDGVDGAELQDCIIYFYFEACNFRRAVVYWKHKKCIQLHGGWKMKKLLLLPTMLFPYFFVLGESEDDLQLEKILVFGGLFLALSLICNVIYMVLARNEDPRKLMGGALLVKLIHIPAFVMIFFYGAVASLMFFMALPLIIIYVVFDYIVLLLSSSLSVFGLVKNMKNSEAFSLVALICQFIFCADVISLLVVWILSKIQRNAVTE